MKKNNIQLQLATLKKEYLQNILFPDVIIIDSRKNKKGNEYSDTYNRLNEGIREFEESQYGQPNQLSTV